MSTTGHELEGINVQGLKASLQKLKTNHIDGKADKSTTLAGYGITDTYTKAEVNSLVTTPNVEYVTVTATQQTSAATDVLPATGSTDTIYRIANWGGSQYDTTAYCEYAWNGSAYVLLSVHSVQAGVPIVLQSSSTALIEPNKFNLWATPIAALEISFAAGTSGYVSEYMIQFTCPQNTATTLTLPNTVRWMNDDEIIPEAGYTYQISIIDGLAVYAEWEAEVV